MPTKESLISYQAHSASECLDRLIARFGDRLGKLTAVDKLDLLGILAFWQSADTQHMEANLPTISLQEYLGLNSELQTAIAIATLLRTFLVVCFAYCQKCPCPNLCGGSYI